MTDHIRAASAAAEAEDAWDRLAALAFGGGGSAGGCSEHAHAYECTCGDPPADPAEGPAAASDPEMETAD